MVRSIFFLFLVSTGLAETPAQFAALKLSSLLPQTELVPTTIILGRWAAGTSSPH
jgi:hypothetical protein